MLRILYVEDNALLRETVSLLLAAPDRQLVIVESAEQAFSALAGHEFDLLITDVGLPGCSGIELARGARALAPHLWVVLMSGYDYFEARNEFGERSAVLTKPFDPDALESLLQRVAATA